MEQIETIAKLVEVLENTASAPPVEVTIGSAGMILRVFEDNKTRAFCDITPDDCIAQLKVVLRGAV